MTSSRKRAAKKKATENRCRLVFVERGTNAFFCLDWRPASEADKLLARGNRWLNTITEIHEKYESVSLQFDWTPDAQPLPHLTPTDRLEEQMQRARGIKLDEAHWREVHQIEQHETVRNRGAEGGRSNIDPETEALIDVYKTIAPDLQNLTPKKFLELAKQQRRVEFTHHETKGKSWKFYGALATVEIGRNQKDLWSRLRTVKSRLGIPESKK